MDAPFRELLLNKSERRARYKRMARITCGTNPMTNRQLRRLPSRRASSKHSSRQEKRQLKRYAYKLMCSVAEFLK